MQSLSLISRLQQPLSTNHTAVDRFKKMPFSELCEIYTELKTSSFTPLYFEALIEIYNEREEFNNCQLLIEG
jgi:hypothetical protein